MFEAVKKANHVDLSKILTRIESTVVIGSVCRELLNHFEGIPFFTLHDCLVTTVDFVDIVDIVFRESVGEFMGMVPTTKISKWVDKYGGLLNLN